MSKKKRDGEKNRISPKIACTITFAAIIAIALLYYIGQYATNPANIDQTPRRAAIIDGIGLTMPNPKFIEEAKKVLGEEGLSVEVYEGSEVTINLLNNIGGYEVLILRTHSAVSQADGYLYIFSAEKYDEKLYITERLEGIVKKAYTFNENEGPYFALRADQLGEENGLKGTTIILMGCNGTNSYKTIKTLLIRGAKAIIAWNGYVDLNYTDEITLNLIKAVYTEGLSYKEAIEKIMKQYGPDPIYKSKLEYVASSST